MGQKVGGFVLCYCQNCHSVDEEITNLWEYCVLKLRKPYFLEETKCKIGCNLKCSAQNFYLREAGGRIQILFTSVNLNTD